MRTLLLLFLSAAVALGALPIQRMVRTSPLAAASSAEPPYQDKLLARWTAASWSGFSNGDAITTWTNSVSGKPDLICAESTYRGYYTNNGSVLNGQPFLSVTDNPNTYTNTLAGSSSSTAVFVLMGFSGTPSFDKPLSYRGGSSTVEAQSGSASVYNNSSSLGLAWNGAPRLFEFIIPAYNDANVKTLTNRVSFSSTKTILPTLDGNIGLAVRGANGSGVYHFWEILFYTNAPSAGETTAIEDYFASKYGIP